MMHLITGGSGSGKSAFAETQVLAGGEGRRIYIATMIPYGEEGHQRVERHRKLRSEKQFETVERYTDLMGLDVPKDSVVLLECMSNLVANEMFEPDYADETEEEPEYADGACDCRCSRIAERVVSGVQKLNVQARHLFVVTNEIFSDGISYDAETMQYMHCLGMVNQQLAQMADCVTEVVYGIPVSIK